VGRKQKTPTAAGFIFTLPCIHLGCWQPPLIAGSANCGQHQLWSPHRKWQQRSALTPKLPRSYATDRSPKALQRILLTKSADMWRSKAYEHLSLLPSANPVLALFRAVREADVREICWCCVVTELRMEAFLRLIIWILRATRSEDIHQLVGNDVDS